MAIAIVLDTMAMLFVAGKGIAYKSGLDVAEDWHAGKEIRGGGFSFPPVELNFICPTR